MLAHNVMSDLISITKKLLQLEPHLQLWVNMNLCVFLTLAALCKLCCSCREEKFIQSFEPEYEFDDYGNEIIINKTSVTKHVTIVCSDIYSLSQILYEYKTQHYEQFLSVKNSKIPAINSMELSKFSTVTKLFLSDLGIKTVSPGAFMGLIALRELYLDNNKIKEVSHGVYNNLQHLEVLALQNNIISNIEEVALTGLSSLTELNLQNNNLTSLNDNFFESLDNLTLVNLSGNPLKSFPFTQMLNVDTLLLSGTSLTTIPDLSNRSMKIFELSSSQITRVDFKLFPTSDQINLAGNKIVTVDNCQELDTESLNLDNNQIEEIVGTLRVSKINLGYNKIRKVQKNLIGRPTSLRLLDLRFNKLSVFDNDVFHNCTSLDNLVLQRNRIRTIDPILFRDLKNLTFLDLSGNLIEEFQFGVFDNLLNLRVLNISDNRLTTLDHKLHSLHQLKELYFDYNQITSFDVSNIPRLTKLSLDHNPWKCQELIKIGSATNFIQRFPQWDTFNHRQDVLTRGTTFDVENFRGIACEDSQPVKGTEMSFKNVEKAISDGIRGSKIKEVFNENFEDSKFVRYFDGDFSKSGFFKYLSNFKFVVEKEGTNGSKSEKLTFQEVPERSDNILVFISVVLTLILLFLAFHVVLNIVSEFKATDNRRRVSEMELCS